MPITKGKISPPEVYARNTRRAEVAGWFIVVGLCVELGAMFWAVRPLSEIIPQVIADCLIAGGVAFELLFGRIARVAGDSAQAEANARVAEAEQRTAELEKLTSWRRIFEHQRKTITPMLKDKIPQIVFVLWEDSAESFTYARELERYLITLTKNLRSTRVHLVNDAGEIIFGLRCFSSPDPIYGQLFAEAFKAAEIEVVLGGFTYPGPLPTNPALFIYVGIKPPPD